MNTISKSIYNLFGFEHLGGDGSLLYPRIKFNEVRFDFYLYHSSRFYFGIYHTAFNLWNLCDSSKFLLAQ